MFKKTCSAVLIVIAIMLLLRVSNKSNKEDNDFFRSSQRKTMLHYKDDTKECNYIMKNKEMFASSCVFELIE